MYGKNPFIAESIINKFNRLLLVHLTCAQAHSYAHIQIYMRKQY